MAVKEVTFHVMLTNGHSIHGDPITKTVEEAQKVFESTVYKTWGDITILNISFRGVSKYVPVSSVLYMWFEEVKEDSLQDEE